MFVEQPHGPSPAGHSRPRNEGAAPLASERSKTEEGGCHVRTHVPTGVPDRGSASVSEELSSGVESRVMREGHSGGGPSLSRDEECGRLGELCVDHRGFVGAGGSPCRAQETRVMRLDGPSRLALPISGLSSLSRGRCWASAAQPLSLPPQFVEVEGQITSLVDLYPSFLRKGFRREIFIAFICSISYLLGLTMVTEVGDLSLA